MRPAIRRWAFPHLRLRRPRGTRRGYPDADSYIATADEVRRDLDRWRGRSTAKVTMTLDPRMRARFRSGGSGYRKVIDGYRVHVVRGPAVTGGRDGPWTFDLKAGETLLACLEAELPREFTQSWQNDAGAKLDAVDAKLDALEKVAGKSYDVGYARELVRHVRHFAGSTRYGRGLAGAVMLRNTIVLSARRTADRKAVEVRAVYVDMTNPRGAERPVEGAAVKLVHVLDAHEEQRRAATTDAAGEATLSIDPTTAARWDFEQQRYARPAQSPATDPVEVHVHDPRTGAHAFALVE